MIGKLDSASRRLYFLFLAGFMAFGMIFTIAGASLPQLIRDYHWSYAVTGIVLAGSAAGYLLSAFLSGLIVQRIPAKVVIVVGLVAGAAGVSLFGRVPSPWPNLVFTFAMGLCQGSMEVVANLEIIHIEQNGQSRLMNLLHAAFSVGAIAGPAAVGLVSGAGTSMLVVFLAAGILLLVLAVLFGIVHFPRASLTSGPGKEPGLRLVREPVLLLLTFLLFAYVGIEIGVSSWSSEFFVQVLGSAASQGAYAVAVVGVGLLVGRLAVSLWYKGRRQEVLMLGLSMLSAAMLLIVLLVHSAVAVVIAFFFTGLGFSAFYPLTMTVVGRYYKTGAAVGTVATGGAAGSILFPFLMSMLSQKVGIHGGFWFYFGLNCFLVALVIALIRRRLPTGGAGKA